MARIPEGTNNAFVENSWIRLWFSRSIIVSRVHALMEVLRLTSGAHPSTADEKARSILSRMTAKEKFQSLTSPSLRRFYSTSPIKRLGIPSFRVTDGPLGLAYHSNGFTRCTRFPATISVAATWNRNLAKEMGIAMANEIRAVNRHMLLAPGINTARTPLNGRTFEYFSEDPFLTKELAIQFVQGVQSRGIGACLKHYAANNQEIDRRLCSSEVDERTLHEIYLRAFREVVMDADPWAVMGCYNKVNGVYGCENEYLIREVLMQKWGFKGFVMSDWFATRPIETAEGCINAGLSLEMPLPAKYKQKALGKAISEGKFTEETLDDLVFRLLRVMALVGLFEDSTSENKGALNTQEHQDLSRRIAEEGMVLLKNQGQLLPLKIEDLETVALVGPNLKKKFGRILYGGSSAVWPPYEITPLKGLQEKLGGKAKIVSEAATADIAIVFVGLNHDKGKDSETYDRDGLELPEKQIELIKETAKDNPNSIVVLIAGSPIAMDDWIEHVPAVLNAWYSGMEGGRAIAKVLFGDVQPSGKLPITFPKRLTDSPAHNTGNSRNYPGDDENKVYYDEGIYVGYRWFDEKKIEPLFPFGYGLSYTSFEFGDVILDKDRLSEANDRVALKVEVQNSGDHPGAEVIQVYSHDIESSVKRPPQELVGFGKIFLQPGEKRAAQILVCSKDLRFYDLNTHDWQLEAGDFELRAGNSSRNIFSRIELSC
ncbi:MAG: glycosyl hydrolase [Candidatus Thorarchaeota archaeon]|nr:glycosyl hydrolase [Candidatus Thorarchaeota archaeon]